MEKLLKFLILAPYFYFFRWQRKVQPGSKYFSVFYYFYWFYLPLMALFSLTFTLFFASHLLLYFTRTRILLDG